MYPFFRLLTIVLWACSAAISVAAPANDDIANATPVSGVNFHLTGNNEGATMEAIESRPSRYTASVWYRWTAPADIRVEINSYGSSFDTALAVYFANSNGGGSPRFSDTGTPNSEHGSIVFSAVAGVEYLIAVYSDRTTEQGQFFLNFFSPSVPQNDHFANATELFGSKVGIYGTTVASSLEQGEITPDDDLDSSVWYRWTAPSTGIFKVDSNSDSSASGLEFAAYSGASLSSLSLLGSDRGGETPAQFSFPAIAGEQYYIAVFDVSTTRIEDTFRLNISPVPPPANDDFENAKLLSESFYYRESTSNLGAGLQANEPVREGFENRASIWYRWIAPRNGTIVIDGERFRSTVPLDLAIDVYTGSSLASLASVAEVSANALSVIGSKSMCW